MGKSNDTDYMEAAQVQGAENRAVVRDQTYANRPTQYTPFGSTTYDSYQGYDPANNIFNARITIHIKSTTRHRSGKR